ncbi:MAG: hypothetical protein KA765_05005, partial [Thermoflexales bacterium]|nr:hypothetical protein [Thermoflexales bacterium]
MTKTTPVTQADLQPTEPVKIVTRFSLFQRIEHLLFLISFSTLGLTGLPQKFADAGLSQFVLTLFGGIEAIRVVHRGAAIIMMALSIYHVVEVLYRVFVQRTAWTMLPVIEDFKHLYHDVLFYFGRRKHKAFYGRYNYAEKAEYLAVVWGTAVMIITGFMMWNPIATTNVLPGEAIPAAKVAHGGEAVLAVLAIILWHFYHVHLRHFNKAMFTGQMTREEMQHEHPAELVLIEAGKATKPIVPAVLKKRQQVFYPIATVIVVVSGFLLFQFVTFEQTAIDTVPPVVTGEAFVPYTPTPTLVPSPTPTITPTPTPGPTRPAATPSAVVSGDSWDTTISAIFNGKCAVCHISMALGDLSLKTYADAVKGGKSGAAIVAGDPDKSILIQIQSKGGHAGQLSADELATVSAWIKAGAAEKPGAVAPAPTPSVVVEGWTDGIDQLVAAKCATCHVATKLGDLSLKTYADALTGGKSGAAIVPNDPLKSVLVQIQQKGGHAGQLTAEEIDRVIAWINAGAPEAGGAAAPAPAPSAATDGWTDGIDQLVAAKCATCHVATKLGDLSLKTYADALTGGKSGAAIVPNDPLKSVLVQIQQKGGHAGQLTTEEIDRVIAWINAGAPEAGGAAAPAPAPSAATDGWTDGIDQLV